MEAETTYLHDKNFDMQLQRVILIICLTIIVAGAVCLSVGGTLWVWICGAWLMSGPIVLLDAYLTIRRDAANGQNSGSNKSDLVGATRIEFEKLARRHHDDDDITH